MLATTLTAVLAFAATNLDDILIVTLFFAQSPRRAPVVAGQFLGFAGLVALSLLGYLGSLALPREWVGLLGLAPVLLGLRAWLAKPEDPNASHSGLPHPGTLQVAAVTMANGADNIGIYTPLFASSNTQQLALTIVVFFGMLGAWCWLGYRLSRQPAVALAIQRQGRWVVPLVLVSLGLFILLESGTLSWLASALGG